MWRKIRSSLILKKIMNNIENKIKFNLILYNKSIQKKLGLDLNDFRRFSGRYKIEESGIIKEFDSYNNILLFEGFYGNNKRNGLGNEYKKINNETKLIFEGEYLDGKKWTGKYYEYDEDTNELIFECEYLNGKIEGQVKEYNKHNGQLAFSGYYLNGKRNGYGTEYESILLQETEYYYSNTKYKQIKIFCGEYLNGERKKGKEYNYQEKLIYEGEYLNGKRNGKGKIYDKDEYLIYEGEIENGIKHGKGKLYHYDEVIYEGEFLKGKKNGKGKEYHYDYQNKKNLLIFEGEFLNNYRLKGKEFYKNDKVKFEGEFLFKERLKGKLYDYDGSVVFELKNNNGLIEDDHNNTILLIGSNISQKIPKEKIKGKEYDSHGLLLFEGLFFKRQRWQGKMKSYYKDELVFEGEYLNGELWSRKGKEYN